MSASTTVEMPNAVSAPEPAAELDEASITSSLTRLQDMHVAVSFSIKMSQLSLKKN